MKNIKVFWNLNELANWDKVFKDQWDCMVKSGLMDAAEQVILMGNGRRQTFTPIVDAHPEYAKNLCFTSVCDSAALFEYPALMFMQKMAQEAEEPFHICYIHMKGLTRWGNPNVDDWRHWLNWCVIERWRDNVEALDQGADVVGTNYNTSPWPHFAGNFWWARSEYVAKLEPIAHPEDRMNHNFTQFNRHPTNPHWRFDHEAWLHSGNPSYVELAKSLQPGERHYRERYARSNYDSN